MSGFTKLELVVVLAISGGLFAIIYPAVQNARNPKGPYGKVYPTIPPSENRRITHPTGISIVAPMNWDQIRDQGPTVPFLSVACRGYPGARLKSWIKIQTSSAPSASDLEGFREIQFNTYPAFEDIRTRPTNSGNLSVYQLYVNDRGQWWDIAFCVAEETTTLSPTIRQYINTITFPDGQITKP